MPEHYKQTIDALLADIRQQEHDLVENKKLVNSLCRKAKLDPVFKDDALRSGDAALPVRSDQYYGQPLAAAVRDILDRRRASNLGPASIDEIFEALGAGGFNYDTEDPTLQKRGVAISISKNTTTFHKIPGNGRIGLREWYDRIIEPKEKKLKAQIENEALPPDKVDETKDERLKDADGNPPKAPDEKETLDSRKASGKGAKPRDVKGSSSTDF